MSHQLLPQNDFFIYVPALQIDELHSHTTSADEKSNLHPDAASLPARLQTWIKIPLTGNISVYISPEQAYEEIVCPN